MSLFQKSVLNKYLKAQEEHKIVAAFEKLKVYQAKEKSISEYKEEEYQDGFLRDVFVNVLGYTYKYDGNDTFNLLREKKNVSDSKKADGAILKEGEVFCVIELKDTTTKDLTKVETQAFGYQSGHTNCKYVIISNFEKLNFYIKNKVDNIEFNLFTATLEEFKTIYLCLHADNLLTDIPLKVKEASLVEDEKVTKGLYKDYSAFKNALWENLCDNHPEEDKLFLFKKTQKLLDRFLFIFFGEDKGLLPPNSISDIVDKWEQLKELDAYQTLYNRFKQYFEYINTGHKEVFAYNGGLFLPDELLNKVKIDDDVLHPHVMKLTAYDFESDVDVNILGHIFEHSLNEIESITAELEGKEVDKGKTKRKKDGVFYTPKYITKYIVENTVGKLCAEKKEELVIVEEEYAKGRYNRKKETIKTLDINLQAYRNWLLQITICDPACGSGAFLNQALEFLMQEHKNIDELESQLLGHSFEFPGVENHILENNLFGVDINEESVEIAKLSLWLRTAQKGRKLTSLNNNIKCGNSLIDDVAVAGDKAFSWKKEFVAVFEKGGFDVVIGNPPYGALLDGKGWLKTRYKETSFGNIDSYKYFVQLGAELVIKNGVLGYIMPDSYLEKEYFKDLRIFTSRNFGVITNIKMGDDVFEEVNLPTSIILLDNKGEAASEYLFLDLSNTILKEKPNSLINRNKFIIDKPKVEETFIVINSIIKSNNTIPLIDVYNQVMGVKTYQKGKGKPKQTDYEKKEDVFVSNQLDVKFNYPYVSQGINRYSYKTQNEYISYGVWLAEPRKQVYFDKPKVVIREIINPRIFATYIQEPAVVKNIAAVIIAKDECYPIKFLLGLVNSKLLTYYVNEQSPKSGNKSYPSFNSRLLKQLPIIKCDAQSKSNVVSNVDILIERIDQSVINANKFTKYLQSQFSIENLPKKLQNYHELEFGDFIKELAKSIKKGGGEKLSKMDEMDWMEVFETKKEEALTLKAEIDKTDKEIDQMVYELYGLNKEEIQIVESS